MSGFTVDLEKPVSAHGDEVTQIILRAPTPEDVMQLGFPSLMIPSADGESVGVEIRAKVIGQYIIRLGTVPMSTVKALTINDFLKCQGAIMGFFNSGDGEQ